MEEKKEEGYIVVNVPTQHTIAIQTPKGELINIEQGIVECMNILTEIKKDMLGK